MSARGLSLFWVLVCIAIPGRSQNYSPPAGNRPPARTKDASILPGGRILAPAGQQFLSGAGPFGLAASPSGRTLVSSNVGPGVPSLTVLESGQNWDVRQLPVPVPKQGNPPADSWHGVSLGVAFSGEHAVYVSEGNTGRVALIDLATGERRRAIDLDQNGYHDSFSGDLAFDSRRNLLYVADQANFRIAVIDVRSRKIVASVATGRLPFAMALAPDHLTLYVTNAGMFRYQAFPGVDAEQARVTGLSFPAFGFPGKEAWEGTQRGAIRVPGLGDPNVAESNSLSVIDVSEPAKPRVRAVVRTGRAFSAESSPGGSSPSGVIAAGGRVYVANAGNDSITVLNGRDDTVESEIPIRIPHLEGLRGILPMGLAFDEASGSLLVAEAGINAVGVVDTRTGKVLGHIPAGWFPVRILVSQGTIFVANLRGGGSVPTAAVTAEGVRMFEGNAEPGSISSYPLPGAPQLQADTEFVFRACGFRQTAAAEPPLPRGIEHVVLIVKSSRSFDEVLGDMTRAANGTVLAAPGLARFGREGYASGRGQRLSLQPVNVTPNQHALAERWSFSDNFYADAVAGFQGRRQLAGIYPNGWTASSAREALAGGKDFRIGSAPGRLEFSQTGVAPPPEEAGEPGTLWRHLAARGISFLNFGGGLDLPGTATGPSGANYVNNIPLPSELYSRTVRRYPGFDLAISDTDRADRFISEIDGRFAKTEEELPKFIYIYLPNDFLSEPHAGYPYSQSYAADNDLALGRIVEYLSASKWWGKMALFVTEDSAQGGADHIDAHRTLLLCIGPWAKPGYVSHRNSSFSGLLKTIFDILGAPPLNLFDASAASLGDLFAPTPSAGAYRALPADARLFQPQMSSIAR